MLERKEYPRPQFRRDQWQPLNGEWEFAFDDADSGELNGFSSGKIRFPLTITVPFSYQYSASGIGDIEKHDTVWYRRSFEIAADHRRKHALLCFNAADYITDVWVNGHHILTHIGGYTPFSADITGYLRKGENVLVVRCKDTLDETIPRGKQCWKDRPFACWYIPNTGIWQSVWLEFFDSDCIREYSLFSDYDKCEVYGTLELLHGNADEAEVKIFHEGRELRRDRFALYGKNAEFCVVLPKGFADDFAWTPENPKLLYVDFSLYKDRKVIDSAHSRIGMRKISVDSYGKICLNNRPYYQKLILDQGYWKESGITPPSAESLKKDIELAKAMGFNGARKHQKLEDPYFYYYAEELGFLTWCEMPSAYLFSTGEVQAVLRDWSEIIKVGRNCTSNIFYVPLNESWGVKEIATNKEQQDFARTLYYLTKALDPTRLISTNDGFENVNPTDIISIHDYSIAKEMEFSCKYKKGGYDGLYPQGWPLFVEGNTYAQQPIVFTEFGGVAMKRDENGGAWGYNEGAENEDEFLDRLQELICGIAQTDFQGFCYTQLTDVQQEVNGLLTADHEPKIDIQRIKRIICQSDK